MKRNNKMLMVAVGAAVGGIFMSAGLASAADLLADWNFNDGQASGSIANSTTTTVSYGAGFGQYAYSDLRTDRFTGPLVQQPAMVDLTLEPLVASIR